MTISTLDLARQHLLATHRLEYPEQLRPSKWWADKAAAVIEAVGGFDRPIDAVAYAQRSQSGFDHRMRHDQPGIDEVAWFKARMIENTFPGFFFEDYPELRESPMADPASIVKIDGVPYSTILLTHLYFFLRITATCERQRTLRNVLEIGGGYGGLARLFKLLRPQTRYWIVDLPESLFFAEVFLCESFPEARVLYVTDANVSDAEKADFVLVPAQCTSALDARHFDVAVNTASLQEMAQSSLNFWMDLLQNRTIVDHFYSWNYYLMNKYRFSEVKGTEINEICPVLDGFWKTRYFAINPPIATIDANKRNWLEICVQRLAPEVRRSVDQRALARRLFDRACCYVPGTPFWFADMWSAMWHAPERDIVQAMLDGISRFAEGKGALNNLVGKPGQSAYDMGEYAYYRSLVQ